VKRKIDNFIAYMYAWNPDFAFDGEICHFSEFWDEKKIEFDSLSEGVIIEILFEILDSIKLKKTVNFLQADLSVMAKTSITEAINTIDVLVTQLRGLIQSTSGGNKTFITNTRKIDEIKQRYFVAGNSSENYR